MVVALLAILKAGAAYLPLSQRDPIDRQVFVLRDAGARVLVTEPGLIQAIQEKAPEISALDVRDLAAGEGELGTAAPVPAMPSRTSCTPRDRQDSRRASPFPIAR